MIKLRKNDSKSLDKSKDKSCRNGGISVVAGKQIYEGSVAARALKRAGKNKNLKGHVYEIMTCDQINLKPGNIIKGKKAVLTKSTMAIRDDVIIKQGNKIVGRIQLKDTPKSIKGTIDKVKSGQYKGTVLMGTKETKNKYQIATSKMNKKGAHITQQMSSNGISSQETELIAKKALGGSVRKNLKVIGKQAVKTGCASGMMAGGIEAASSAKKILKKEKTLKEAAVSVPKEAAIGGASGIVGDATATAVTMAVAATPVAPAAPVVGTAAGLAASMATDKVMHNTCDSLQNHIKERSVDCEDVNVHSVKTGFAY